MSFTSLTFLLYFLPIVILLYYGCSFSRKLQNFVLFLVSILFYAWGQVAYVPILLSSILINTVIGWGISTTHNKKLLRRIIFMVGLIFNVGVLFYFKYIGFAIDTLRTIGFDHLTSVDPILPIGISFFTFQSISYLVDVYRKKADVIKNPFTLGLYIAFFPTLLSGPIVRFHTIQEQLFHVA